MVQVFAEFAVGNGRLQVLVGGRHHAHIDADVLVAAHAGDFVFLQGAKHLGLGRSAHVAHFVQEQSAALGLLELSFSLGHGACEGAFFMPKQLALDQFGRNGGAVHLHKWTGRPSRVVVHLTGHELLAGSVGPGHEHTRVGGRHRLHHVLNGLDALRLPDHLMGLRGVHLLGQHLRRFHKRLTLEHVAQRHQDPVEVERLLDEVVGPFLQSVDRRLHGAVPRNHDHRRRHVFLGQHVKHIQAVHLGHFDVAENGVECRLGGHQDAVHPGACFRHLVALVLEDFTEAGADGRFVVDQEKMGHGKRFVLVSQR